MTLSPAEKQDLRHAVLYAMANRPDTPLTPMQIRQSLVKLIPFDFAVADVQHAIMFHADLGHVRENIDEWGSETAYVITAQGTLAYERDTHKIS